MTIVYKGHLFKQRLLNQMGYLRCVQNVILLRSFSFFVLSNLIQVNAILLRSPKRNYTSEWMYPSNMTIYSSKTCHCYSDIKSKSFICDAADAIGISPFQFQFPPKIYRIYNNVSPDPPKQGNHIYTKWEEFIAWCWTHIYAAWG